MPPPLGARARMVAGGASPRVGGVHNPKVAGSKSSPRRPADGHPVGARKALLTEVPVVSKAFATVSMSRAQ
jgi:hypothetical protein